MRFIETSIPGAFVIELDLIEDERGFFARSWCTREFEAHGLNPRLVQCSVSFSRRRGTLRGLHYQAKPHEETKLIRCTAGAIYDVLLDLRPHSSSFRKWIGEELSAVNRRMLYCPEGVAHGFQTLTDDAEIIYQMSEFHHAECARGVRWDDPDLGIAWPQVEYRTVSEADENLPGVAP